MIVNKKDRSEVSSNIKDSVFFGIKKEGFSHIFNVLRNQLYSDKELAVVREYSANAYDAHAQKGIADRPFEVNLPSRLDPFFRVRDFGNGLTHDEVHEIYANYGESTKRCSNDYIGQLGLGSKSAFAYTDTFNITSVVNGEKCIYSAFIDETDLGKITLLDKVSSDEEDGIEISVPVKQDDIDTFVDRAVRVFRHYKVRPTITGQSLNFSEKTTVLSGDDWRITDSNTSVVAVMGNIGYPINGSSLDEYDSQMMDLYGLEVDFEIGELEMSASREALQYTELTKASIDKKFKRIKKQIVEKVSEEFGDCSTVWEAKCLWYKIFDMSHTLYRLRHIVSNDIRIKSCKLDGSDYCFDETEGTVHKIGKTVRSRNYKVEKTHRIECKANVILIENDLGHNRGLLGRILPLKLDEGLEPYVISIPDQKVRDENNFDPPVIRKLSEFPKVSLLELAKKHNGVRDASSSSQRNGDSVINTKHTTKVFTLSNHSKSLKTKASDYWAEAEVDFEKDSGVYVVLDRFKMQEHGCEFDDRDGSYFNNIDSLYESLGLDKPTIYGVKLAAKDKAEKSDNWITLKEYFSQSIIKVLEDEDLLRSYLNSTSFDDYQREYDSKFSQANSESASTIFEGLEKDSAAYDFFKNLLGVCSLKGKVDNLKTLVRYVGIQNDIQSLSEFKGFNFLKQEKKLLNHYPMLRLVNRYDVSRHNNRNENESASNYIAAYIKQTDNV